MRSSLVEPSLADNPESLGPQGPERRSSPARTIAQFVGVAAVGLGMMALSAGLAWSIRGHLETEADSPGPEIGPQTTVGAQPDRKTAKHKTGRLAYQVHCARCHGPEGRGDGADAAVLRPSPRDLSSRPWTHGETPEAVRSVILRGIPGTAMTGWGHLLSPEQLDAVVDYVRSLGSPPGDAKPRDFPTMLLRRAGFEPVDAAIAAPSITFQDLDGRERTLEQERGKGILLVFWGTTCAPCVDELPALDRLADEFGDDRLAVRPICVDEPDEALVREIARTRTKHLSLFVDRTGLARLRYDVQTLPSAVLIDREGRLLGRADGGRDWLAESVREALRAVAPGVGDAN
jgi:mono/diheme cytochrome c family protein/peroxiredoxin